MNSSSLDRVGVLLALSVGVEKANAPLSRIHSKYVLGISPSFFSGSLPIDALLELLSQTLDLLALPPSPPPYLPEHKNRGECA